MSGAIAMKIITKKLIMFLLSLFFGATYFAYLKPVFTIASFIGITGDLIEFIMSGMLSYLTGTGKGSKMEDVMYKLVEICDSFDHEENSNSDDSNKN